MDRRAPIDRTSATWQYVEHSLMSRLQTLREKNDATLPEFETAVLRGEIRAIKFLLSLPDTPVID